MASSNPFQPLYTGNNVQININGHAIGLVETITVSRSAGRSWRYAVGSPLGVDAPVGSVSVTVTATSLVPINPDNGLPHQDINPSGSMLAELGASAYPIDIIDPSTGILQYSVTNAFYNQDAVQVPSVDTLTLNLSWIAQDTGAWS